MRWHAPSAARRATTQSAAPAAALDSRSNSAFAQDDPSRARRLRYRRRSPTPPPRPPPAEAPPSPPTERSAPGRRRPTLTAMPCHGDPTGTGIRPTASLDPKRWHQGLSSSLSTSQNRSLSIELGIACAFRLFSAKGRLNSSVSLMTCRSPFAQPVQIPDPLIHRLPSPPLPIADPRIVSRFRGAGMCRDLSKSGSGMRSSTAFSTTSRSKPNSPLVTSANQTSHPASEERVRDNEPTELASAMGLGTIPIERLAKDHAFVRRSPRLFDPSQGRGRLVNYSLRTGKQIGRPRGRCIRSRAKAEGETKHQQERC